MQVDEEEELEFKVRKKKTMKKGGNLTNPSTAANAQTTSLGAGAAKTKKPIFSYDNESVEEDQVPVFKKKIARNTNVVNFIPKPSLKAYNLNDLKDEQVQFKKPPEKRVRQDTQEEDIQQLHQDGPLSPEKPFFSGGLAALIPSDDQINMAKKLREQKRAKLISAEHASMDKDEADDGFISLKDRDASDSDEDYGNKAVSTFKIESRLITEDQAEEMETFDDYNGTALAFGAKAIQDAQDHAKMEKLELIQYANEDQEEDDEQLEWELQHIHDGQGANIIHVPKNTALKPRQDFIVDSKIPNMDPLLTENEIIGLLDAAVNSLTLSIQQHEQHIEFGKKENEESEKRLVEFNKELDEAKERYDFFQGLCEYVVDLVDFLDAKEPLIERVEGGFVDLLENDLIQRSNAKRKLWITAACGCFNLSPSSLSNTYLDEIMNLSSEEELQEERNTCFDDASKHFKKISHVKERFDDWKKDHPKEYNDAHGALSMAGVFDLYVRYEIWNWRPFSSRTFFDEMNWHEQLMDFGVEDSAVTNPDEPEAALLTSIVEKTCIPRLQTLIPTFDIFNRSESEHALKLMNHLLDYVSKDAYSLQSLKVSFENRITNQLESVIDFAPKPSSFTFDATADQFQCKIEWVNWFIEVMETILLWKMHFSGAVIKKWLYDGVLGRIILPAMETCHDIPKDLELYCKISDIVKDLVPDDVYQTPPELKFFEVSFLKHIHLKVEKKPELQSKMLYSQILYFLTNIKSFQACSIVAKKLQELQ